MTKRTRILRFTCVFLACLLLSGCWDSKELDTLFIVTAIGLDAAPIGEEIELTIQVGKVGQGAGTGEAAGQDSHIIMRTQNKSVYAGINYLRANSTRNLFLEHNQVIVIGRELAEQGIEQYLDVFMRDLQTRMEVWLLVSDEKSVEILDMELDVDKVTGTALSRILYNRKSISTAYETRLLDMVSNLIDGTTATVVPLVEKAKVDDREKLFIKSLAVFQADKMVGTLDAEETWGYILAKGEVHSGSIEVPTGDGRGELRVRSATSKIEPTLYKDGNVRVDITIDADLLVGELIGFSGHTIEDFEDLLAVSASDRIQALVMACADKVAALNADLLGIGQLLEKKYAKAWPDYRDRWAELYPQIEWRVHAATRILDDGRIATPLTMEEDKRNDNAGW